MGDAIQEDYPNLGRSYMAIAEENGLEALVGMTPPVAQEIPDISGSNTSDEGESEDEDEEGNDNDNEGVAGVK